MKTMLNLWITLTLSILSAFHTVCSYASSPNLSYSDTTTLEPVTSEEKPFYTTNVHATAGMYEKYSSERSDEPNSPNLSVIVIIICVIVFCVVLFCCLCKQIMGRTSNTGGGYSRKVPSRMPRGNTTFNNLHPVSHTSELDIYTRDSDSDHYGGSWDTDGGCCDNGSSVGVCDSGGGGCDSGGGGCDSGGGGCDSGGCD